MEISSFFNLMGFLMVFIPLTLSFGYDIARRFDRRIHKKRPKSKEKYEKDKGQEDMKGY